MSEELYYIYTFVLSYIDLRLYIMINFYMIMSPRNHIYSYKLYYEKEEML